MSHAICLVHLCYTGPQLVPVTSFVYPDWASIFNLGIDSATEELYTTPFFLKISLGLLFHHLNFCLVSTTCYSLCTRKKFQPFSFSACFLFALGASECTFCWFLPTWRLLASVSSFPQLLLTCLPRGCKDVYLEVWILGCLSLLGKWFLHILPFWSLLRIFCCSSALISHSVYLQSGKIPVKQMDSPDALWDRFLLNGVMFFVIVFSLLRKGGRKVKTLGFYISQLSPCFSF